MTVTLLKGRSGCMIKQAGRRIRLNDKIGDGVWLGNGKNAVKSLSGVFKQHITGFV